MRKTEQWYQVLRLARLVLVFAWREGRTFLFTLADRLLGVTYTPHCLGQIGNLVVCCGVARVDDGMPRWKEISY